MDEEFEVFPAGMPVLVETDTPDIFVGNVAAVSPMGILVHKTHRLEEVPVRVSDKSIEFRRSVLSEFSVLRLRRHALAYKSGLVDALRMTKSELVEYCLAAEVQARIEGYNEGKVLVELSSPILSYTPIERVLEITSAEDYNTEAVLRGLDFVDEDVVE